MIETLQKYNPFWQNTPLSTVYKRTAYLDSFNKYINNPLIKVILGQRRVGKSYLLRSLINHLIKEYNIPAKNILYINKDIQDFDFIKDSENLFEVINEYKNKLKPKGTIFIFLDEIQEIKNWEKAVNSLSQDYTNKYEVFITGSNAKLLSKELSTYISGRYVSFEVFPFSYSEFLGIKSLEKNKESFLEYLKIGGLPEIYNLDDEELKKNYISSLKDSVVLRDIITRHNLRDSHLLEKIIDFIIDSIGSMTSTNSITKHLKTSGYKTNNETIGNYLQHLTDSYFIHAINRYDLKGKNILAGEKKYYLNDLSFKYYLSSSFDFAISRYLENIIYLHLRRQGYNVYVGKINNKEIDFIAEKDSRKKYIQVAYLLNSETIIDREFNNLMLIKDNFEKVVVSLDDICFGNKDGIEHINAWDFVLTPFSTLT